MLEGMIVSTLAGSFICIALLILKNRLLSLLGGRVLYGISLLAMLLFLLPINIGQISMPQTAPETVLNTTALQPAATKPEPDAVSETVTAPQPAQEEQTKPLPTASGTVRRATPVTLQEILLAVWLSGFIISMCRYFISYFRFKRKICGFEVCENIKGVAVIKSPLISSPMIFGFFRPTLAIPEAEMPEGDYNLAIRHEMVHYKHHDSWFKLFAVIVNSICWFNPITYFMVNLIGEACEYACDEQVTREMSLPDRKRYSEMILSMVCQASPALSSNMVKSKKQLKRRFEVIMTKKSFSLFRTVICMVLMLAITCGSVVFANEVAPAVSSLLKDDYVYISTYGNNAYNEFAPVEKNGVYYLPLREFLNDSNIENDKIKYENGMITVDIWTNEMTLYNTALLVDGSESFVENASEREIAEIIPAKHAWSTFCTVGSKEIDIDGSKYTMANAPYLENGVTYVPYEYFQLLKDYEQKSRAVGELYQQKTTKFVSLMLFGYDSSKAEYYTDYIQMGEFILTDSYAYATHNAMARIAKTGYRTEFEAEYDYFDLNYPEQKGHVQIKLNQVNRIYSKGSDIEGLFTVLVDDKVLYDNQTGYINTMPIPAGEGVVAHSSCYLKIGDIRIDLYFLGLNSDPTGHNALANEKGKITTWEDTVALSLIPEEVKLNGYTVTRASKSYSYIFLNKNKRMLDLNMHFDSYTVPSARITPFQNIYTELDSKMSVIDENTISAELYFGYGHNMRIDSFDAIITLLPDDRFELKSTDGAYIVRGQTKAYVPQWQWSEEQRNAPVPQVVMIDE